MHDVGGVAAGAVGRRTAGLVDAHRVRLTHSFLLRIVRVISAGKPQIQCDADDTELSLGDSSVSPTGRVAWLHNNLITEKLNQL